ncbi:hypothetical protein [Halalkalibacter krulwichiae]|uniref:Phage protein, HK97 gp10 family n=2 Tax=Halalkalibacter krulwichiae TaxID=199441 RepID=A0A1X9MM46_9BACI|nr:hypothetical protein [Halalkalibacter krulwichiae]ARK32132.1 hypothetical protein BkAM31D_21060 [Halalkalibacter krulwichiae]
MEIDFQGLEELIAEVENLERASQRIKNRALIRGGDLLKERIEAEVYSHGLSRRSGTAQESIVRTNPKNDELFVGTQGGVQAPGFYLYMHEFGYFNVRAGRFIGPRPLVSIVYQNSINDILEAQADELRKGLGL